MSETHGEVERGIENAYGKAAMLACQAATIIEAEWTRPSVLYRPCLSLDGDKWCALYGPNLQEGVAGFGDSPADAMAAFDQAWREKVADRA